MDFFKQVESLTKYRLKKIVDVTVAVFIPYTFQSYIRRLVSGVVPFGVIHVLLISALVFVECIFLKKIKSWSFDQYISVPGLKGVFSKADVKGLLCEEDFICPQEFIGTYYEEEHKLYDSKEWLCICDHFFHKKMIAAMESRCIKTHHTLGHNYLYIVLYTGSYVEVRCGDTAPMDEKWDDFLSYIHDEMGGFLLNDYTYKGFIYNQDKLRKLQKMLKEEIRKQSNPKNWLLSGAAIEFYKKRLDKEIKAKEQ